MQQTKGGIRLTIREIDTKDRRDAREFIRLPFRLYRDCDHWVPPLLIESKSQLDRKNNPFYLRNDAAFFLAVKDGRTVGRIAVYDPRYLNDFKKTKNAHFNLFDCENDRETACALFDAASDWARERGLETLRGPFGFMAADGFGILSKGFDLRPAVGIPYNYEYYNDLVKACGFEREERVFSGYFHMPTRRALYPKKVAEFSELAKKRYGFSVRSFDTKKDLKCFVAPRIAELYNRTLTHIAGDPPIPEDELSLVVDNLLLISNPKLHKFVMKGDEFVGFLFCFIDISEGLRKANGRLFPFGYFHIMRDFKKTSWVNYNGMGVVPEHQGKAATAIMYTEIANSLLEFPQYEHAEVIQISEFNRQSLNEMTQFGVDFYKEHSIYRKAL